MFLQILVLANKKHVHPAGLSVTNDLEAHDYPEKQKHLPHLIKDQSDPVVFPERGALSGRRFAYRTWPRRFKTARPVILWKGYEHVAPMVPSHRN